MKKKKIKARTPTVKKAEAVRKGTSEYRKKLYRKRTIEEIGRRFNYTVNDAVDGQNNDVASQTVDAAVDTTRYAAGRISQFNGFKQCNLLWLFHPGAGRIQMSKKDKVEKSRILFSVGDITKVDPKVLYDMLEKDFLPIVAPIGLDDQFQTYNINADTAAARIAAELGAENLILMTDIAGLLRDKDDPSTLIPEVNVSEVPFLKRQGIISGGMIPKIDCCVEAVRRGVRKTVIIDGRVPHSILIEILSNEGIGTQFV